MQENDWRTAAGDVIENFSIIAEGLFHAGIIWEDGDPFPEATRPSWIRWGYVQLLGLIDRPANRDATSAVSHSITMSKASHRSPTKMVIRIAGTSRSGSSPVECQAAAMKFFRSCLIRDSINACFTYLSLVVPPKVPAPEANMALPA